MRHKKDKDHLKEAILRQATFFTSDRDFEKLHHKIKTHYGIIMLYKNNNPKKDMSLKEIVKALKNLERLNFPLQNSLHKLNDFNF